MRQVDIVDPVIYKITNMINGKVYIGQTKNFDRRMKDYKRYVRNFTRTTPLIADMREFGYDNFEKEILIHCTIKDLNKYEKYYINEYNATDPDFGYNTQSGGSKYIITKATRKKMPDSHGEKLLGYLNNKDAERLRTHGHKAYAVGESEVILADSMKIIADYLGTTKDMVSHAAKRHLRTHGYYIIPDDPNKREKIYNNGHYLSDSYVYAFNLTQESVEAIEKTHKYRVLTYDMVVLPIYSEVSK